MHDRYCDHDWARDDAHSKVCIKCKRREEIA
jgi:hypothetical protein